MLAMLQNIDFPDFHERYMGYIIQATDIYIQDINLEDYAFDLEKPYQDVYIKNVSMAATLNVNI